MTPAVLISLLNLKNLLIAGDASSGVLHTAYDAVVEALEQDTPTIAGAKMDAALALFLERMAQAYRDPRLSVAGREEAGREVVKRYEHIMAGLKEGPTPQVQRARYLTSSAGEREPAPASPTSSGMDPLLCLRLRRLRTMMNGPMTPQRGALDIVTSSMDAAREVLERFEQINQEHAATLPPNARTKFLAGDVDGVER